MAAAADPSSMPNRTVLNKLVTEHMVAAFAAGLIPVTLAGMAVIGAIQLHLLKKLTLAFGSPFSKNALRAILAAVIGGAIPVMAGPFIVDLVKGIPVAGTLLNVIAVSSLSAAITYVVGNLFIAKHG